MKNRDEIEEKLKEIQKAFFEQKGLYDNTPTNAPAFSTISDNLFRLKIMSDVLLWVLDLSDLKENGDEKKKCTAVDITQV